jgi:hypothetical protein
LKEGPFGGPFSGTKSDKIAQKVDKNVQKMTENAALRRPVLLKRVKSCGSRQSIMCFGPLRAQPAVECGSGPAALRAKAKGARLRYPLHGADRQVRPVHGDVYLLIPQWLMADLPRRRDEDFLNLKDLLAKSSDEGRDLPGLCRASERWCGLSVDSAKVVG